LDTDLAKYGPIIEEIFGDPSAFPLTEKKIRSVILNELGVVDDVPII